MRAVLLAFLLMQLSVDAQELPERNWHFRIPMGLTIGVNAARLENSTGPGFTQRPGSLLALNAGVSLTRKERWGVAVEGGLMLDNYGYGSEGSFYSVSLLTGRVEARATYMIPFSTEHGTHLYGALGHGFSFFTTDSLRGGEGSIEALSYSPQRTTAFLAPEVGIGKGMGRHRLDLALRYQLHLEAGPSITTELRTPSSSSVATASGDHLALIVRFHLGVNEQEVAAKPLPSIAYQERDNDTVTTVTASRPIITLVLWDNAEQDGDTLSLLVNGRPVVVGLGLTHGKRKVKVRLRPGANTITIIAHNEGRVPPNTASCIIRTGKGRQQVLLKTSMKENDVIRVTREQ